MSDSEYSDNEEQSYDESEQPQSDDEEAEDLREQLRDVPLGEIKKLKDQVGLKKYNQVLFGLQNEAQEDAGDTSSGGNKEGWSKKDLKRKTVDGKKDDKVLKKKSKSEPEVVSSKKRNFNGPRHVVKNMKRSTRDPRFNDLSGAYNEELFQKSYAFVDDIKKNEYESVKKQLKKVKNTEEKEKLLKLKQKMDTESKVKAEQAKRREMSKQRKKEMAEQTDGGKKPFYLKNSDKKKIESAEKYKELKASGKLDKYMSKKRKRNTQKDKKNLPRFKSS